jgi:hypothetical protein
MLFPAYNCKVEFVTPPKSIFYDYQETSVLLPVSPGLQGSARMLSDDLLETACRIEVFEKAKPEQSMALRIVTVLSLTCRNTARSARLFRIGRLERDEVSEPGRSNNGHPCR